jgi:uncharacterized DUF497 family protein
MIVAYSGAYNVLLSTTNAELVIPLLKAVTILVVVHVYPNRHDESGVRIIGARKATRHERKNYEEGT